MIFEKQRMFDSMTDMNGNKWCQAWVDTYNRFTDCVNKSAGIDIESGSMTDNEREFCLDQRHKFHVMCLKLAIENQEGKQSELYKAITPDTTKSL